MPLPIYQEKSTSEAVHKTSSQLTPATSSIEAQRLPIAKYVIAIAAGKGGVGKSTLCTNLALTLRLKGYRVGALDADIYGPSLRRMIREDRLPLEREGKLEPALAQGIALISMAHFSQEHEASVFRAPIATRLIEQFLHLVEWNFPDFLLIDLPPGTGDIALTLAQKGYLTGAILISTPQKVATQDVGKCIDLFERLNVPILGLVENMAYWQQGEERHEIFGQGGVEWLAKSRGYPLLASLPLAAELAQSSDEGIPFVLNHPNHSIKEQFDQIADYLIESCRSQAVATPCSLAALGEV